jgi:hypothetical protein
VHDYTLTDDRMPLIRERITRERQGSAPTTSDTYAPAAARAEAHSMHTLLDTLTRDYGGAAGWARAAGIDDETVARLRRLLVDDG